MPPSCNTLGLIGEQMIFLQGIHHHVHRIVVTKVAHHSLVYDVSHRVPIFGQLLPAQKADAALVLRIEQISGGIVRQCHVCRIFITGNTVQKLDF